jgi:hypothetical protein
MKEESREIRKVFTFLVNEANKAYSPLNWELNRKTIAVKAIQLSSDYPDKLYYRGAQRIEIGGDEIFPEGFDSKFLMSSVSVGPHERFFQLGDVLPGDLSVKVRYEDKDHQRGPIESGYQVKVILLIEERI